MGEQGRVIALSNNLATIEMKRSEACAKCRACTAGLSEKTMLLEADNVCNAGVGDTVEVDLSPMGFINATLIMYLFPLAMMLIGFGAGWLLSGQLPINEDLTVFLTGLFFLAVSYGVIRLNENTIRKIQKYRPIAKKIV